MPYIPEMTLTLYVSRNNGGRGPARNNTNNTRVNRTRITRKQKWKEKLLYGRFKILTSDISLEKT